MKGITYQKEKMIVNLHAPNVGAPKFIKQTVLDLKV
jgi:hypothetical protein